MSSVGQNDRRVTFNSRRKKFWNSPGVRLSESAVSERNPLENTRQERVKFRIHLYELTRSTCLPLPTPLAVPTAAAFSVMQAGQFLPHLHRSVSIGRQANDSGALQSSAARVTAAECADAVGFGQALGRGAYEWPAKRWPVSPISAI